MEKRPEEKLTPMMEQFYRIKQQHPDKILFYRMGDFYEMFGDDAVAASKVLQIQLTSRNKKKEGSTPLCGVPIHAYDQYLNKLTNAGFKVAVCEQVEDPAQAKGLVERKVVRIITPGTVTAPDLLKSDLNSFLCSFCLDSPKKMIGVAFCDLSTGEFEIDQLKIGDGRQDILELIYLYQPREIILPKADGRKDNTFYQNFISDIQRFINSFPEAPLLEYRENFDFDLRNSRSSLKRHFSVASLRGFGIEGMPLAVRAAGSVLKYLRETQKDSLQHIVSLKRITKSDKMSLDDSTIRNLELFESADGISKKSTLIHLINNCQTPMGARKLRRWMSAPLIKKDKIEKRLDAVQALLEQTPLTDKIRFAMKQTGDLERIIARVSMPFASIADLVELRRGLPSLKELDEHFKCFKAQALIDITKNFDPLSDLEDLLKNYLLPQPNLKLKEGGFINPEIDEHLGKLKKLMKDGKLLIAGLESEERKKTGISSLKIGYNKIFGYYLDVSNASKHLVPDHYIRKQTLVNNERYVTEDLKELEENILTSQDKALALELEIFEKLKKRLRSQIKRIQIAAKLIALIDVLSAFAYNARIHNYTRPTLDDNPKRRTLKIKQSRHPVIETLDMEEPFVPNDVLLNSDDRRIMVITGPNMGGKSTYMRQIALIALMAQIGSYIPAEKADLPVFDRIFTRVGASDNLTKGQSTFMVEMCEAASILNNATSQSLIILDEIGRGTGTFDGISIAWAIVEYLQSLKALTFFATHYHELILLEEQLPGVVNAKVIVKEEDEQIIFLRKVTDGKTSKSYGIQVARLAGLPANVIKRAEKTLKILKAAEKQFEPEANKDKSLKDNDAKNEVLSDNTLSENDYKSNKASLATDHFWQKDAQLSFMPPEAPEPDWVKEVKSFDLDNKSPMQAMKFLYRIKKKIG